MLRVCLAVCLVVLGGCAASRPRPTMLYEADPIVRKSNIDEVQIELIAQMEACIEEARQDNKNMRAAIRKTVSDCICPSEMK